MADNERIVVWIRLRDTLRFRRDAHKAAEGIKEITKAAEDGGSPLSQLGGAISGLIGKIPQATGRTRIFGFAIGTVITALVAAIPLIVGLGGAVVALAGSLGAAALGAGALGVAVAGAAIPLGALGLVALDLFQGFQKVSQAWTRWQVAIGTYGQNSKQAETALARMNAIAKNFGGRYLIRAVAEWNRFQSAFRKSNAGVIHDIARMLILLLQTAEKLLPVFSAIAKQASGALLEAFHAFAGELTSQGFQNFLYEMGNVFVQLSGPLGRSLINIFMGLFAIAARLAPTVHWLFTELENASMAFRGWAEHGALSGIVSQFQSWWGLIKAVGGLLVTILGGGASAGQNMVDSLTKIVNQWNAWLNTAAGQRSMKSFFHDAGEMTKALAVVLAYVTVGLFKFGRALLPIYTTVFKALVSAGKMLIDAFKPMAPFLNNILFPLLKGLAEGVIASIVGAFKTLIVVIKVVSAVLGFVGKVVGPSFKGAFELIGKVIGFLLGGPILKLLSKIGEINIVLRPLGFLFRLLAIPIELAGRAVEGFAGILGRLIGSGLTFAARFSAPVRNAIASVLNFFQGAGARFFDAGVFLWRKLEKGIVRALGSGLGFAVDIGKAVYNWIAGKINKAIPNSLGPINIPNNPIPMLASGGVVSGNGSWITGEAGPEINVLREGKVTVVPLSPAVRAQGTSATLAPTEGKRTIVSKVYLRGRQIAEAVADEVSDEQARR